MTDWGGRYCWSKTSVHVGCFTTDYTSYLWRDPRQIPKYSTTRGSASILSNRVSWFLDIHRSGMTIDTAYSSSMIALELACKGLWGGSSDLAIVWGANLISPQTSTSRYRTWGFYVQMEDALFLTLEQTAMHVVRALLFQLSKENPASPNTTASGPWSDLYRLIKMEVLQEVLHSLAKTSRYV